MHGQGGAQLSGADLGQLLHLAAPEEVNHLHSAGCGV
jgi:hypothetical protein